MKKKFISAALWGLSLSVVAQDSIRNTGNLQLHAGASISGFGVFQNAAGSHLVNGGTLYLRSNLINDEVSMAAGTGTLYLNGTVLQQINGTQPFLTFNLNTNNAAGFLLNNDLSIAGIHSYTAGMISSSGTPNYLVYENGATYSGDNDARHVNGWVRKNGSDDFSFPLGDAVYERKIAVSNLSGVSAFTSHYYTPTFNIFNLQSPLVEVKENEYWQINKISGGTATIIMNWDHSKVAMNHVLISEILAGYYTAAKWNSIGGTASGNVLTTGQVTSSSVSNFGYHTIGYTNFPLPLSLISFTGNRGNGTSWLEWITENEAKVDHFTVERSFDAVNFSTVGQVQAGNRGHKTEYTLQDPVKFTGQAFYRLGITDIDGKQYYSGIIVLNETGSSDALAVINPVQAQVQLQNRTGTGRSYTYRLISLSGQLLQSGQISFSGFGGAVIPLNQAYAKGIYQLELRNEKENICKKIVLD